MSKRKRFGEILLGLGIISEQDLKRALIRQKITQQPLGQIFERLGIICDKDILRILARQYNLQYIERIARPRQFDRLSRILDGREALKKRIFPLGLKDQKLYLATCNALDLQTLDGIAFRTGCSIVPILATPTEIDGAIRSFYFNREEPGESAKRQVLIADDQEICRQSVAANLRSAGYRPLEATTGPDAIQLAMQHLPDLVLLELSIPDLCGKEVFRTLQTNRRTGKIPIIALSTASSAENEAMLLNMGFFDFVPKPFKIIQLMARVRRAFTLCLEHQDRHLDDSQVSTF